MEHLPWVFVLLQMFSWGWFNWRAGKVTDWQFLLFALAMMGGQLTAAVEAYHKAAWKGCALQIFFFVMMLFGAVRRWQHMQNHKHSIKILEGEHEASN